MLATVTGDADEAIRSCLLRTLATGSSNHFFDFFLSWLARTSSAFLLRCCLTFSMRSGSFSCLGAEKLSPIALRARVFSPFFFFC